MKSHLRLRPTRGVAADPAANEVSPDFYTGVSNVHFRGGFAGRVGGSRAAYGTLPVEVLHMLNARIGTTNFWLFFGADEIHANETSNSDDVTGSALTPVLQPWQWSSTLLNGVPVATNGLNLPRYWAGDVGTGFTDLPGWPASTTCKTIVAFAFHLVALDIDGPSGHFESQVKWSDAAEPGTVPATWLAAADNEAGDTVLGDTPGPCLCAVALRGSLLIYKRTGVYSMDYIPESEEVFAFRQIFSASGALTRHSVCDLSDGRHFVVGDGDIYITDGVTRRSVAKDRMADFVFNQLDQDNYENLFAVYHRAKNEVWVCFPEQGSQYCTLAAVYDVTHDSWGVRVLVNVTCAAIGIVNDTAPSEAWADQLYTWAEAARLWNQPNYSLAVESLVTGAGTAATQHDTQDAVEVDASLSRYDLAFGEPERVKFVRRVQVRAKPGFGTLYVRVGARFTPTAAIQWSDEVALVEPEQIVNTFAQGRYISVEVRSEDDEVWEVSGIDLEAELRGYF